MSFRAGTRMLAVLPIALSFGISSFVAQQPAPAGGTGSIVVTIDGFRNKNGHAHVGVYNNEKGFPDNEKAAFRGTIAEIGDGPVKVRFDGLAYGQYAVSMYHDENDDGTLNKKAFGIPKEGYGVSNNIVHSMRAPGFSEAAFALNSAVKDVNIHVHY
jgi:uncharacterized protein (DUF2141 family)